MIKVIDAGMCKLGILPGPKPVVLVSCGTFEMPNIIAVSYFGQVDDQKVVVALRPPKYSNQIITETQEFTVNYIVAENVNEADYCGVVSGRQCDKFKDTGLTKVRGISVKCPSIKESPLSLECRVMGVVKERGHDLFFGNAIKVVRRGHGDEDWLYHDGLNYFGVLSGYAGRVFLLGKKLKKRGPVY